MKEVKTNMLLKTLRAGSLDAIVAQKMEQDVYHALSYVRDGDWVFDIGANVGAFCAFVARATPKARIVCVEPMPDNLEALRVNAPCTAIIEPVAIASYEGDLTIFHFGLANSGCHSMYDLGFAEATPFVVPTRTLSGLLAKYDIPRLRFLKLDCQGAEYDVLTSAGSEVLERIDVIAMEVHKTIAADDVVIGTIPNQLEAARRMFQCLQGTHRLVHGTFEQVDTEQVWVRKTVRFT